MGFGVKGTVCEQVVRCIGLLAFTRNTVYLYSVTLSSSCVALAWIPVFDWSLHPDSVVVQLVLFSHARGPKLQPLINCIAFRFVVKVTLLYR
jgi:hypothetical protein